MKKTTKLFSAVLALILALALAASAFAAAPDFQQAVPSPQTIIFNGETVEMEVYNIDGSNYFKLRDIAMLLKGTGSGFSVDYDAAKREMIAQTGKAYVPVGGELAAGTDKSATTVVSEWTLTVDGAAVECYVYNIGGNNFFKLRDLGMAFHFDVDYSAEYNAAVISSIDWYEANVEVFQAGSRTWTIGALKMVPAVRGTDGTCSYRGARVSALADILPAAEEQILVTTVDGGQYTYTGQEWADAVVIYEYDGGRIADAFGNTTTRFRLAIGDDILRGFASADVDPVVFMAGESYLRLSDLKAMPAVSGKAADGTAYTGTKLSNIFSSMPPAGATVIIDTYDGSVNAKGNAYTGAQLAEAVLAYTCGGSAVYDEYEYDGALYATYVRMVIGGDIISNFSTIRYGD